MSAETWVADTLRRSILTGQLGIGARLRQSEIAAELGVSTTPVREALRSLMAEGLLEIDTNRGAIIRELGDEEIVEILELQLLLERKSLTAAFLLIQPETIAQAKSLHKKMLRSKDPAEWALLNRDFHLVLSGPSGQARTLRMLRELLNVSTIQLRQDIAEWEGRRAEGERDHSDLLEAAEAGDAGRAAVLIDKHTGAAIRHRQAMLSAE